MHGLSETIVFFGGLLWLALGFFDLLMKVKNYIRVTSGSVSPTGGSK